MSNRMRSYWLSLAVLSLLLVSFLSPQQSRPASAGPAADPPPSEPMQLSAANKPRPPRALDARALLDRMRAEGGIRPGASARDPKVARIIQQDAARARTSRQPQAEPSSPNMSPNSGQETAPVAVPGVQSAASLSARPDRAQPSGLSTPIDGSSTQPYNPAAQAAGPQASSPNCYQALTDPNINGNGAQPPNLSFPAWPVYDQKSYYADDYYTSSPYSFVMIESGSSAYNFIDDDDNVIDTTRGTDIDSFGQVFNVPSDAESLTVEFNFLYASGSAGPSDRLYYEFYQAPTPNISSFIVGGNFLVSPYANGNWWTRTETFDDPAFLGAVRGKQIILRISTYNNNDSTYPVVWFDDIYATVCGPSAIVGQITQNGAAALEAAPQAGPSDLSDALLLLTYESASEFLLFDLVVPDADGNYEFTDLSPLAPGSQYQVWYLNVSLTDEIDDSRLSIYIGPVIGSLGSSEIVAAPTFDITDVKLLSPEPYAEVVATDDQVVQLTWQARGIPGDAYQLYMYDPETIDPSTGDPVEVFSDIFPPTKTTFNLGPSSFDSVPSFNFRYGHEYSWYVALYNGSHDAPVGYSFYEHPITFLDKAPAPPNDPKNPDTNPPPPGDEKTWTVMVYLAGDNNLGDVVRNPNPLSNLQGQFEALKTLAAGNPNVNLVTLTDFYGNTGTQFCYLSAPGGPQCQELGEKNTADPATLTKFINDSLSRYPAERTMLVIADHGHSIIGVASDETSSAPGMAPDQIRQAFDNAGLKSKKLDILLYDACLMGTLETAWDASAYARFMVASTDQIWVLNFFDRVVPLLSSSDPRTVAAGIVNAYIQSVDAAIAGVYKTMAAYDLSKVDAVNSALSALGDALTADKANPGVDSVRRKVQVYDSSGNNLLDQIYDRSHNPYDEEEDAFVDLKHLATLLSQPAEVNSAAINSAAASLLSVINSSGLVIASQQQSGSNDEGDSKNFANALGGIGIFFPNGNKEGDQPTLVDAYLYKGAFAEYNNNNGTKWDDFLRQYLSGKTSTAGGGVARGPSGIPRGGRPIAGRTLTTLRLFLPLARR